MRSVMQERRNSHPNFVIFPPHSMSVIDSSMYYFMSLSHLTFLNYFIMSFFVLSIPYVIEANKPKQLMIINSISLFIIPSTSDITVPTIPTYAKYLFCNLLSMATNMSTMVNMKKSNRKDCNVLILFPPLSYSFNCS